MYQRKEEKHLLRCYTAYWCIENSGNPGIYDSTQKLRWNIQETVYVIPSLVYSSRWNNLLEEDQIKTSRNPVVQFQSFLQ
jgi:hypothetical protein